jgi:NADPH:quinone reductase-like Zn-dependent oxidoreductase
MTTIKSVIMTGPGTYGFGHIPKPEPAANQFLIKVDSAVINPSDILFITGKTGAKVPYPFTPGWEGSGVIEALGTDVAQHHGHLLGKRVGFFKQRDQLRLVMLFLLIHLLQFA